MNPSANSFLLESGNLACQPIAITPLGDTPGSLPRETTTAGRGRGCRKPLVQSHLPPLTSNVAQEDPHLHPKSLTSLEALDKGGGHCHCCPHPWALPESMPTHWARGHAAAPLAGQRGGLSPWLSGNHPGAPRRVQGQGAPRVGEDGGWGLSQAHSAWTQVMGQRGDPPAPSADHAAPALLPAGAGGALSPPAGLRRWAGGCERRKGTDRWAVWAAEEQVSSAAEREYPVYF